MAVRPLISPELAELGLTIAGGALVVGVVMYVRKGKAAAPPTPIRKKATGVVAKTADCRDWSLEPEAYNATARPVYETRVKSGIFDPWIIADSILGRVAPTCRSIIDGPRNVPEATLQYLAFYDVVVKLWYDDYIDEDEYDEYLSEIHDWGHEHGISDDTLAEIHRND